MIELDFKLIISVVVSLGAAIGVLFFKLMASYEGRIKDREEEARFYRDALEDVYKFVLARKNGDKE